MEVKEFEDKLPSCTDDYLRSLYAVKDALLRDSLIEAIKIIGDILSVVCTEIDYCYRTDRTLPYYREFLMQLADAVVTISKVSPRYCLGPKKEIQQIISDHMAELEKLVGNCARWPGSERPDDLEKGHRARTYPR